MQWYLSLNFLLFINTFVFYDPTGPSANPSFSGMKQPGVFLLPPGWNGSPLQGYSQR